MSNTAWGGGLVQVINLIKWIFTTIGACLLALAIYLSWSTQRFALRAIELPGEVTNLLPSQSSKGSTTYSAEVLYTGRDGEPHTVVSSFSSNPPAFDVGEAVIVLQDPAGERRPLIKSFMSLWGTSVIVGGIGSVFFLIGGGFMLAGWRTQRRHDDLRARGQPVEADIQGVERNTSLEVNGRHPFVVVCQWLNPQTRELHLFRSENLWFDPGPHLDRERVRVLIEPGNPRRYLVDLSFLPKLAD